MCGGLQNSTMFDPYEHMSETLSVPVEIVPAILTKKFRDIERDLALLQGTVKRVQIDAVDGVFAHPKSWPYTDPASFDSIVTEEHGLPHWDTLDFEFDLMIADPCAEARNFVRAGASRIVLHAHSPGVLEAFQGLVDMREDGGGLALDVGVALLPSDQPDLLEPFESAFDYIQVMGVERIGRQGEPFDQRALFLVERLRRRYPRLPIQVDGGVSALSARALARAGATRFIVGSAIFGAKDPVAAYRALVALVAEPGATA